jgi:hypothetical protein
MPRDGSCLLAAAGSTRKLHAADFAPASGAGRRSVASQRIVGAARAAGFVELFASRLVAARDGEGEREEPFVPDGVWRGGIGWAGIGLKSGRRGSAVDVTADVRWLARVIIMIDSGRRRQGGLRRSRKVRGGYA